MPKEDVSVRAASTVRKAVSVFPIDRNEAFAFKILHICARLGLPDAQFKGQGRKGRIYSAVTAGVAAEATATIFAPKGRPRYLQMARLAN
jgi:hypothetical protein